MIKVLLTLCIALFFLTALFVDFRVLGQEVCPLRTLDVKSVRGYVLDAGRNAVPVRNTKLELRRLEADEERTLSVFTDGEGFFEFPNLEKGEFRLSVYFMIDGRHVFPKYDVVLNVARSRRTDAKRLIIKLGPDCFQSSAYLQKRPGR